MLRLERTGAVVRPWQMDDAEALARHANARSIWLNLTDGFPHPYGLQDARAFIEGAPPTYWCIEIEAEAAGGIGLTPGEGIERYTAELGYWLGETFWGRGIVSEAVAAVTEHGFEALSLHRIFARPYARNPASTRVLDKCGYTLEGRMRHGAFKDGSFVDQLLYARVASD